MGSASYIVSGLLCPVIVSKFDPDALEPNDCGGAVAVILWSTEHGVGRGDVLCTEGHTLAEMAHDNVLDLDGVPYGA